MFFPFVKFPMGLLIEKIMKETIISFCVSLPLKFMDKPQHEKIRPYPIPIRVILGHNTCNPIHFSCRVFLMFMFCRHEF